MSDIFKKIRSIEAEDDAVTRALGLTPGDDTQPETKDTAYPDTSEEADSKPLNLSIPDDDDILDLDELSLEPLDAPFNEPDNIDAVDGEQVTAEAKPQKAKPKTRLGLSPILPLAAASTRAPSAPPRLTPIGQTTAEATPLPDFLDTPQETAPLPDSLTAPQDLQTSETPVARTAPKQAKAARHDDTNSALRKITIAGIIAALIWIVCTGLLLTDLLGREGAWAAMNLVQKLGFALMALFPLALIALTTYAFRHLSGLSRASGSLQSTAEALMTPDDTVITRSTIMAKSIQAQVDEVNLKVSSALTRMDLLDDMVKSQGSSLAKSTLAIDATTSDVEHRISTQRNGLESIAGLFEGRMATLSDMLEGHTSQLATSGQMAEQRVQEARVSVEGAAEKIATASEIVRQNAVAAAQTLSGSHTEITKLGDDVQAQSTRLDAVYRQHLNDLKVMLTDLRDQQDELGATMEERLSKMRDMSLSAKVGAQNLTDASIAGRETVEALNEAASLTDTAVRARFSEMEEMVRYSTTRAESISETATRQVQNSLSTTRKEIARIEADMMDLMDKLSRAESAKPVFASPTQEAKPAPTKSERPPMSSPSDDLGSMEFRDISNEAQPSEPSLFSLRRTADEVVPPLSQTSGQDLEVHQPKEEDLPAVLRRPSGDENTKDRGKWSLRGMFSGDDTSVTKTPSTRAVTDESIIERLTALGLTPAAIVDDGCIIEAANLRKVKGAAAMSQAVAKRLSEPVRHLFLSIETDADLKSDIRAFAAQFDARLAPNEGDREAIRTRLESDAGRAYLLCDAVLNA